MSPVVIVAPSIVRYTFKHQVLASHNVDNVVDVSIDLTGVGATRDDAVDDFNSHICGLWQDAFMPQFTSDLHFLGAHWIDLNSATGRTGELGPAGGHAAQGAISNAIGAMATSYLIKKNTTSGRGSRPGRMYMGPAIESTVDPGGVVQAPYRDSLTARAVVFRQSILYWTTFPGANAAWRVVHVHKLDKDDPGTWTWSSSDVDSVQVDNVVANQRRRQRP